MSHPNARVLRFALLGATALALGPQPARATDGQRIYEQQCANCHGAKGEGVNEKYDDPLTGDWSVAKLTRYVAANMPEDKPETLTPAEADAVSRYIHDAFYSREAQARINPARIELSHLTKIQYLTSVADLLRGFSSADEPPTNAAGGLDAIYYNVAQRGRFDSSRVVHRGVDPGVDFDYSEGCSVRGHIETEVFSAQWRGALIVDETGDYEFNVRTPNSVRLWINGEPGADAPVLDVNVSTPEQPDHRVTVRLLGGRRYPLAIDFWAFAGKLGAAPSPGLSLRWRPPHGSERPIPARHLTTAKVKPTYVVAAAFPADDSSAGYERSGPPSKAWDEATTNAALEVANHVGKNLNRYAGTHTRDPERAKKIEAFAARFTAAAYRRPLTEAETSRYVTERFKAAPDPGTAARRAVIFALKSPQFLYTDLAPEKPGPHQVASRLAFGLWDSLPDRTLLDAAAAGRLRTRAEVAAQAQRMVGDFRARAKVREFFLHWLQMRYLEEVNKDPALYPDFTDELIDDLRTSLNLFVDEVVWSERSDFRELLRADYMIANERLAKFYELPVPADGEFARVPVTAGQPAGVLTHPYLLAALSYKSSTSPIHRGVFLTRNIVGRALKSPPVAAVFKDEEFTPDMTMREKVVKLTRSESCIGCHAIINPLGFSLEWYDAVGRFRTEDKGRPIDAASDFFSDDHQPVRLGGPRDVAEFAIASERANDAFIERVFHHVVKQPLLAYGPKTSQVLRDSFIASGYNLQKLLVEIATLAALRGVDTPALAATPSHSRP